MNWRALLVAGGLLAIAVSGAAVSAAPFNLTQRSVSTSKQFIVYCPDPVLRSRIASFAEEVKADVLTLLGESDRWKFPVVITLDRASADNPGQPAVATSLIQDPTGFKVEIDVRISDNPAAINLQKQLVRALLLEFEYRIHPKEVRGGERYAEPPWWLVEGAIQIFRKKVAGLDPELFRRLVETNKIMPIEQFLRERPEGFGGKTAEALDQALAMCLVQLLIDQPAGRDHLCRMLQHLPTASGEPAEILLRDFPSLVDGQDLQKWWTLNLARLSATNRYKGLSAEESDAQLSTLVQIELPADKTGEKKSFPLAEFDRFLKVPASREALKSAQGGLVALSAQANALYRPILAEYDQIFSALITGKTRGLKERIAKVEKYRESVLKRVVDIADYLNWFEATQMDTRSDAFDSYLKAASELETPAKRMDPVSQFLDEVAQDF